MHFTNFANILLLKRTARDLARERRNKIILQKPSSRSYIYSYNSVCIPAIGYERKSFINNGCANALNWFPLNAKYWKPESFQMSFLIVI